MAPVDAATVLADIPLPAAMLRSDFQVLVANRSFDAIAVMLGWGAPRCPDGVATVTQYASSALAAALRGCGGAATATVTSSAGEIYWLRTSQLEVPDPGAEPTLLLVVQRLERSSLERLRAFARRHALTSAETEVTARLLRGMRLNQIAAAIAGCWRALVDRIEEPRTASGVG